MYNARLQYLFATDELSWQLFQLAVLDIQRDETRQVRCIHTQICSVHQQLRYSYRAA